MQPFDDDDLKPLLSRWEAPEPPDRLRSRIFGAPPRSPWAWMLTGSVRVPVPAIVVLVIALVWLAAGRLSPGAEETVSGEQPVSLADFRPAEEMRVRIVEAVP